MEENPYKAPSDGYRTRPLLPFLFAIVYACLLVIAMAALLAISLLYTWPR
jgi:hypothetical protein